VLTLIQGTGFEELTWIVEIDPTLRWHTERLAAMPDRPLPLGLHLVLGETLSEMFRNQCPTSRNDGSPSTRPPANTPDRPFSRTILNKTVFRDPELLQALPEGSLMTTARISAARRRFCEQIGLENDASRGFQEKFLLLFSARC
jgi:hypothetical protein